MYNNQIVKVLLYDTNGDIKIINYNGKLHFKDVERKYYFGIFYSVFIITISNYIIYAYFVYSNIKLMITIIKNNIIDKHILYFVVIFQLYIIYISLFNSVYLFIGVLIVDYLNEKIKIKEIKNKKKFKHTK